jgi:hypothetical protein
MMKGGNGARTTLTRSSALALPAPRKRDTIKLTKTISREIIGILK